MEAKADTGVQLAWGPKIDLSNVPDVFAPQQVAPFTPPETGIDNLGITSTDTFMVPGYGEFTVDFEGYVRVVRSEPTADNWPEAEVYTNLIEMCMRGESAEVGPIIVTLNPECLSTGQIRNLIKAEGSPAGPEEAKACRMAVGAQFHMPELGKKLFNKEPIELTIDDVKSIPPAGNPGEGRIYQVLPLFDVEDPEGRPAAYLTGLKFAMGSYKTAAQIQEIAVA
ncbi:MAG TPA: DUF6073 family protein [Rhodothermales bacterium]|nr:DUF6073 family protein [Rhodothermales bacterium]